MERKYLTLLLVVVANLSDRSSCSKQYYEILPKPMFCKVLDADIVYNYTCTTILINRTTTSRTREIIFQPGVEVGNYHVNMQLFRQFGSTFRPFMIKIDQDLCSFMSGNHSRDSTMLAKLLNIEKGRKFGNFYDPCPLLGRRYEKNVLNDYSHLPDIFPAAVYRLDLITYTFVDGIKKDLMFTQVSAEVRTLTSGKKK